MICPRNTRKDTKPHAGLSQAAHAALNAVGRERVGLNAFHLERSKAFSLSCLFVCFVGQTSFPHAR